MKKTFARAVLTILFGLTQASGGWAANSIVSHGAHKSGTETLELSDFSGRIVAELFSHTCSEKNWVEFSKWAKDSGFLNKETKEKTQASVDIEKKMISLTDHSIEVIALDKGGFEAHVGGKIYRGEDTCDLMLKVVHKAAQTSLLQLMLPSAFAIDNLVQESRGGANADLIIGGITAVASLGLVVSTATVMSVAGVFGFFNGANLFVNGIHAKVAMTDFEKVLNSDFTFNCTPQSMTITAGSKTVFVNRMSQEIVMRDNGALIHDAIDSKMARNSRQALLNLSSKCRSPEEAQELNAIFHDEHSVAQARQLVLHASLSPLPTPAPLVR